MDRGFAKMARMETDEISYKQRKRRILIVLGIAQIIATTATLFLGRYEVASGLISIFSAVGWAVGILLWVKVDSDERGAEVSSGFRIALIILGIFAFSYYLIKTRGFVGGLKAIGWTLLYFIMFLVINLVIAMIVFTIFALAGIEL